MTCADTVPNLTGLPARACVSRQIFAYSSGLRGLCSILPVTIGQRHDVWISCSSVPASYERQSDGVLAGWSSSNSRPFQRCSG